MIQTEINVNSMLVFYFDTTTFSFRCKRNASTSSVEASDVSVTGFSLSMQEVCRKCSRASACVFQWKVVSIKHFVPECSSVRKESFITTPVLAVQVFCFSYFPVIYAVTGIHSIESFIFS